MTKPQPNPAPHAPPVCAVCNYNLSGVPPLEDKKIVCPECGSLLRPVVRTATFTRARLHKKLLSQLLIPIATPPAICILLLFIYKILPASYQHGNAFVAIMIASTVAIALIGIIIIIPFWIAISISAIDHARPYPRPIRRWAIPLLALLYTLPAIALYFLLYFFIGTIS